MELPVHLLYIFAFLIVVQNATGNGNYSVIQDLRPPKPIKQIEVQSPLASLILDKNIENGSDTHIATDSEINSRVKRQYYGDGYYYDRNRYYPYPLPIITGGGIFGPGIGYGRGFNGRGFGGRGFGGRGFGGRGIGGRGGGIGGRGVGGGRGGGGGRG